MAVRIVQRVNIKTYGLKRSNVYLREELSNAGVKIGQHLQRSVRAKQRIDTGEERRRTLQRSRVTGATRLRVTVFNTVVQALVDETGARWRGTMPPSHPGSKLYAWVARKGLTSRNPLSDALNDREKEIAAITLNVARSIARRGLPRPGDALRKPFETTRREEQKRVEAMVEGAVFRSVRRINGAK